MVRRGWIGPGAVGLLLVAVAGLAGCGSNATVGTASGPATTGGGTLVAQLECGHSDADGKFAAVAGAIDAEVAIRGQTAIDALRHYLAADDGGRHFTADSFEPAARPPSDGPVQAVSPDGTVSVATTEPGATAWFAHRGADGRVDAVAEADRSGSTWSIGQFSWCESGAGTGGATATTGTVPGLPASTATVPVPSTGLTTTTMTSTAASTTTMTTTGG